MKNLSSYFEERLILFFQAKNQEDAMKILVDKAFEANKITDPTLFLHKVLEREKIVSTGIGLSVAIPHAKLEGYDDFFIVLGILSKGIDWHAIDGHPVRILFLIGGPDDKQNEYLKILSTLTGLVKDDDFRKKLLTLNSPKDMMSIFNSPDSTLK